MSGINKDSGYSTEKFLDAVMAVARKVTTTLDTEYFQEAHTLSFRYPNTYTLRDQNGKLISDGKKKIVKWELQKLLR